MKTFVIAESGSSHAGDLARAIELVHVARDSGADCCKFQYWSSAKRLAQRRNAPELEPVYAAFQVPRDWLEKLRAECDEVQIAFACTSYLPGDVWAVAEYCDYLKVASFE